METFCLLGLVVCVVIVVGITTYLESRLHKLEETVKKNFSYLSNCIRILSLEQNRIEGRIKTFEKAFNNNRGRKGINND